MNISALETYLHEHPTFKWLDSRYVSVLAELATTTEFDAGEYIFRQSAEATTFFLILQGRVSVETACPGREGVTIQTLAKGDILGWSWLFAPYAWNFDARAIEKTRAVAIDAKRLRTCCEADHQFGYELMKRFASIMMDRLQAAQLQLLDLYGAHVSR